MRIRKSPEERKKEILEASMELFLEKGFKKTTMEDVVNRTTLSKGGVYRYYSSTMDMLKDILIDGMEYRKKISYDRLYGKNLKDDELIEAFIEESYKKIVDRNRYKKLYAMFIFEESTDPKLCKLKEELEDMFFIGILNSPLKNLERHLRKREFIDFLNLMIVGVELMGMRESFSKDDKFLKGIIRSYYEKEGIIESLRKER